MRNGRCDVCGESMGDREICANAALIYGHEPCVRKEGISTGMLSPSAEIVARAERAEREVERLTNLINAQAARDAASSIDFQRERADKAEKMRVATSEAFTEISAAAEHALQEACGWAFDRAAEFMRLQRIVDDFDNERRDAAATLGLFAGGTGETLRESIERVVREEREHIAAVLHGQQRALRVSLAEVLAEARVHGQVRHVTASKAEAVLASTLPANKPEQAQSTAKSK